MTTTTKPRLLVAFTLLSYAAFSVASNPAGDSVGSNIVIAVPEQRALREMGDRLDVLQHEINRLRALSHHHHRGDQDKSGAPEFSLRQNQIQGTTSDRHEQSEPAEAHFTLASDVTILFPWFKTDTWESYSFALVLTLFLATALEFLNGRFRQNGRCQILCLWSGGVGAGGGGGGDEQSSGTSSIFLLLCNAFARFIAAAFQYSLILIIATYDAGLFFTACGGTSLGYFVYNWLALKGSEGDIMKKQTAMSSEIEKPSNDEDSSKKQAPDIEEGSTHSSGGLRTLTINRLETISEDGQSKASCASTEDGGSLYSFTSSGTKSRNIPYTTADKFEDEPKTTSTKSEERLFERRSSNGSSNISTTADDLSIGSSASRNRVTVVIRDTNALRAKLAAFDANAKKGGDDSSVGCRSVPAAKRDDDDRSIGNNSLRSVPVSLSIPGANRASRGFGKGRRARNVSMEI